MYIFILYTLVAIFAIVITLLALYFKGIIHRLIDQFFELRHHQNLMTYDLAKFICYSIEEKAKVVSEINDWEKEMRHKARKVIYLFEQQYKFRETHDENISSSTEPTG